MVGDQGRTEQETIIEYKNYKLRENFAQQVMKPNKFQEQYIFIADDDEPFAYNNQGKKGLLYVLTQNLLIDSDGEIEHLVNYLDQKDIYGEFTLYVKDTILSTGTGNTYLEMINSLFNSSTTKIDSTQIVLSVNKLGYNAKKYNDNIKNNLENQWLQKKRSFELEVKSMKIRLISSMIL